MNALDLVIVVLGSWTAWAGHRLGFAQRVLAWSGFLGGLWLGSVVVSRIFSSDAPSQAGRFLQALAVVVGVGVVGQALGNLVGRRARRVLADGGLGTVDAVGGVVVGVLGLVVTVWFVVPAMADVPGWPAQQARTSAIARAIDGALGQPPPLVDGLSKAMGASGVPDVFDSLRGAPEDVPVPPDSPVATDVVRTASESVVKVRGPACGRLVSGSGWVVADDLIVTNAHVVAGTTSTEVLGADGSRWSGRVVAFDSRADLAVVRVRGLGLEPLEVDPAERGDVGVVLGYPRGGDLAIAPYIVGQPLDARGEDIYGRGGVLRRILVLGSRVQPGDSGGPLIDGDGQVAGVVFAVAPDRDGVAYAIRTTELEPVLDGSLEAGVDVGPCI